MICFRNIKGSDEEVSSAIEMLKLHGFINYYGLQRFGNSIVSPTYVIGKSLASGNYKEVKITQVFPITSGDYSEQLHFTDIFDFRV